MINQVELIQKTFFELTGEETDNDLIDVALSITKTWMDSAHNFSDAYDVDECEDFFDFAFQVYYGMHSGADRSLEELLNMVYRAEEQYNKHYVGLAGFMFASDDIPAKEELFKHIIGYNPTSEDDRTDALDVFAYSYGLGLASILNNGESLVND